MPHRTLQSPHHHTPTSPTTQVLHERNFPYSDILMLASARSAGKKYAFEGVEYTCEELTENRWGGGDAGSGLCGGGTSAGRGIVRKFSALVLT